MKIDSLYTILIPSHNRPFDLNRLVNYYSKLKCEIIVCDSSDKPLDYAGTYNLLYMYLHGVSFFNKLKKGLAAVQTPYVLLHPDDDFVSILGLRKAATFLHENSNFVSVMGQSIGFVKNNKDVNLMLRNTDQYLALLKMKPSDSSTVRMHNSLTPYSQTVWTLHRTEVLRQFVHADISWFKSACLYERFFSLFFAIHGNTKFLPVFFCARQFENLIEEREQDKFNYTGPGTVLFSTEYKDEIGKMCKVLAAEMVRLENIPEEDAYVKIQSAVEQYKKTFHSNRHNFTNSKIDRFFSKYNPDKILAKFVKPIVVSNDRWGKSFFFQKNKLPCYRTSARDEIKNIVSIIRNDLKN